MHQNQDTANAIAAMAGLGLLWFVIILCSLVLGIIVNWRIAAKAGYPGAISLLMLVPFANLVLLLIFAFGEWPIERTLKAMGGMNPMPPPPAPQWQPPATTA
jgi:uncharacterized membrane protein YhaH (DUF805 family)